MAITAAAAGDLNGDGAPDLLVLAQPPGDQPATGRVLFNNGSGTLVDSTQRLAAPGGTAVALGDVDGDGDADALIGSAAGVTLWLNQGGVLAATQTLLGRPARSLLLADLDGDGDPDAPLVEVRQATLWWNDGHGDFEQGQRLTLTKRHGVTVGDLNGDGRLDIFAGAYDDDYRVWCNAGDGRFRSGFWSR